VNNRRVLCSSYFLNSDDMTVDFDTPALVCPEPFVVRHVPLSIALL